jgi:DNA helicase HerA-like ATPase
MRVMGVTDEQEVLVVSSSRAFRINEYLVLEDPALGNPRAEVVETHSSNRFLPFDPDRGFLDPEPFDNLRDSTGFDVGEYDIHYAKVRLLERVPHPVRPGTPVREPSFSEVRDLLIHGQPERSLVLGVIHATDNLTRGMDPAYQNRLKLLLDGQVRDQNGVPFLFDPRAMQQYPHIGIFGGSGSGKSFGLRVFLEELMKLEIPTLAFDPHFELTFTESPANLPAGYRDVPFEDRFVTFQVGRDVGAQFTELNTRDLLSLLAAASPLSEQMVGVVEAVYRPRDSYLSFHNRLTDLADALELGKQGLDKRLRDGGASGAEREEAAQKMRLLDQYGSLPMSSVKGVKWRLERLEKAGLFGHDIAPVEQALRAGKLAVIQGPIWVLNVFASYLTGTLYRQRRDYRDAKLNGQAGEFFPPFVVATDEAHNFAPKGLDAPAKSILKEIAQEGRKYGVFLILATQRPALLDETITAQLNTKCIFRTVRATDIATIQEETDLTREETRRLPFLRSGDTYISSAIFGRTIPVRIRMAKTTSPHGENPFDELQTTVAHQGDDWFELLAPRLPLSPTTLHMTVQDLARGGRKVDVREVVKALERLAAEGRIKRVRTPFGDQYEAL